MNSKFRFTYEMFKPAINTYDMADQAQKALDAHLATLPKVYGFSSANGVNGAWTTSEINATHTAILFDIQEIEKKECDHEPVYVENKNRESWFECEYCGKSLKIEKWSEA